MDLLQKARVAAGDLAPDPLHPFRVSASPEVRRRLMAAGWATLDDAGRAPVLRAVLAALDDTAWTALFDATTDHRMAAEPDARARWTVEPWARWRTLLDDEAERRARPAVAVDVDRRASQRETLLALLRARGPRGALNLELNRAVGFRYSARLKELRDDGYVIRTDQLDAQRFRYVLEAEPGMKQRTMEVA